MPAKSCAEAEKKLIQKNDQLTKWEAELEALINKVDVADLPRIQTLKDIIETLGNEILGLKADQRRLKCLPAVTVELSQDNFTILSTSSVRRKDASEV